MKTNVVMAQYWCVPTSGEREPFIVSEAVTETHIAGLAQVAPHLIFYEVLIDLGLTYDDEREVFEPIGNVRGV